MIASSFLSRQTYYVPENHVYIGHSISICYVRSIYFVVLDVFFVTNSICVIIFRSAFPVCIPSTNLDLLRRLNRKLQTRRPLLLPSLSAHWDENWLTGFKKRYPERTQVYIIIFETIFF